MEHILQFGVNIDDEAIISCIKERATQQAIYRIQDEISKYTRGYESKLDKIFREEVKKLIDSNKDEIIEKSIDQLAFNLTKTKAVKEAVNNLIGEIKS